MLERLSELKALYEISAGGGEDTGLRSFSAQLVAAFPDLCRAYVEAVEENRLLRGLAATALVTPAPNAAPLTFEGFLARVEGDIYDSLNEYASAQRLVIGDEFVITETYCRDVHYAIQGGPTAQAPLQAFRFAPEPTVERVPDGAGRELD